MLIENSEKENVKAETSKLVHRNPVKGTRTHVMGTLCTQTTYKIIALHCSPVVPFSHVVLGLPDEGLKELQLLLPLLHRIQVLIHGGDTLLLQLDQILKHYPQTLSPNGEIRNTANLVIQSTAYRRQPFCLNTNPYTLSSIPSNRNSCIFSRFGQLWIFIWVKE